MPPKKSIPLIQDEQKKSKKRSRETAEISEIQSLSKSKKKEGISVPNIIKEDKCQSTPNNIKKDESAYMEMKLEGMTISNSILPQLAFIPPSEIKNGLESDISLSKIRLQTVHVVYRGLCSLVSSSINKTSKFITQKDFTFTLKLPQDRGDYATVDFTKLFTDAKSFTRDQLSEFHDMDVNMLTTIAFLEKLKSQFSRTSGNIEAIDDVLNYFIVCSSGKEYLDVGQLYAIVEPNHKDNISIMNEFWTLDNIIARKDNILLRNDSLYPKNINEIKLPTRPFFETHDSAAAPIAGKYFNTYTEATINVVDDPVIDRTFTGNYGSIPFLYDNIQVLYLCFLYNHINKDWTKFLNQGQDVVDEYRLLDEDSKNYITVIRMLIENTGTMGINQIANMALFDLFYMILVNQSNTNPNMLKDFFTEKQRLGRYRSCRLTNNFVYDLMSSVYYFFKSNQTNSNYLKQRQNIITANLDSLCHDNKDSPIYRYLMMYNLIKKNNNSSANEDENPLLNELYQTFRENLPEIPREKNGTIKWENSDNLDSFLTDLISNFQPIEQRMFYLLYLKNWQMVETRLINRMLCDNCYVFLIRDGDIEKKLLISMCEALGITDSSSISARESKVVRRASYTKARELFPLPSPYSFTSMFSSPTETNHRVYIRAGAIIPKYARCCCDLNIHENLSLTRINVYEQSEETSIFNITPVTLNDAASAALDPAAIYLPEPVTISFGNPNQYSLIFFGKSLDKWDNYKRTLTGLKYYHNLSDFESKYNIPLEILKSNNFIEFPFYLLKITDIDYNQKLELYNRICAFIPTYYDNVMRQYINSVDVPYLQYIFPAYTSYNSLYNLNTVFQDNLKKSIEMIQTRLSNFKNKFEKNPNTANKKDAIDSPPIFKNLVDGIMDIIVYINKTISDLNLSTLPNGITKESLQQQFLQWLVNFISDLMKPFTDEFVPVCKPILRGGDTENVKTVKIPQIISITTLIGKYGFYQIPDYDGGLMFKPINSLEEQKQVWEMLGLQVNVEPTTEHSDTQAIKAKGVDTKSSDLKEIRKESIIRQLMKTKGLSFEQARAEVNKPYQLREGKDKYIAPATTISELRKKYSELKEAKINENLITSSVGTQKSRAMGGKLTKKKRRNIKRKGTFRKKNKNIIRKTRRKY